MYRGLSKELVTNILSLACEFVGVVLVILVSLTTTKNNIFFVSANLGGIYSLFVGFSALTLVEIIYYGCIRFYLNYRKSTASEKIQSTKKPINQRKLRPVGAREIIRNYSFQK